MKWVTGIFGFLFKLYIALVFGLTLLVFYPIISLILLKQSWKRYTFPFFVVWSWIVRVFCLVIVVPQGKRPDIDGPYIIVANHTSYYDIFLMYSLLPKHRFLFLGKSEILKYPLLRTFFKRLNIPVYRNNRSKAAKSFIQAVKAVDDGWSLMIFPEGGIPDDNLPAIIPFKDGAFKLAKRCAVSIVPITFLDNYHLFSDPEHILGPAHPGISRVYFHDVILPENYADLTEQELSNKVYQILAQPLRDKGLME